MVGKLCREVMSLGSYHGVRQNQVLVSIVWPWVKALISLCLYFSSVERVVTMGMAVEKAYRDTV